MTTSLLPEDASADVTRTSSAAGANGTVTVQGDRVTIHKGLTPRSFGVRGERQVPLQDITAVRVQPATPESNGYLELILKGNDASMGGLLAASSGEYTVMFTERSAAAFEQVRAHLQAALEARTQPARTAA